MKSPIRRFFPLLALSLLLSGCGTVMDTKEITNDMDFVLGPGFTPPVRPYLNYLPKQILVLPPVSDMPTPATDQFVRDFLERFSNNRYFHVVPWSRGLAAARALAVNPIVARQRAVADRCDAFLLIELSGYRPYPPLALTASFTLTRVSDNQVILQTTNVFNSANERVANSARRFYQHQMPRQISVDRSQLILRNMEFYTRYTAYLSAQSLLETLSPRRMRQPSTPPPSVQTQETPAPPAPEPTPLEVPIIPDSLTTDPKSSNEGLQKK